MLALTHLVFALLVSSFLSKSLIFISVALLSSLLPDLDEKNSKVNRMFRTGIFAFFVRHRGILHTIYPPLIVYLLLFKTSYNHIGLAVFVGYVSHLVSDGFTKAGVNFLYPLSTLRLQGPVETGTWREWIFFGMVCALVLWQFI